MADYAAAVMRPFSDWKKLLIGMALYVVPFLSMITGIFATGYLLRCMQSALKGDRTLPEWSNWGELFLKGLLITAIGLLYAIPAIIIITIAAGTAIAGAIAGGSNITAVFAALGGMFLVVLILILLTMYIVPTALLQFARTGQFGAAFALGAVWRTMCSSWYFRAWLAVFGITIAGGVIAGIATFGLAVTVISPYIVYAFLQIITGIMAMTIFGMAAAEE